MTGSVRRHQAAGRRPGTVLPRAVVVAGLAAVLVGGSTFALWSADVTLAGGSSTTGALTMELGTATWKQVTPGVLEPESGVLGEDTTFVTMPGDVVEIVQPVSTSLLGDNLRGGFSADLVSAGSTGTEIEAGRLAASFSVLDSDGSLAAPASGSAELGEVVAVPGLVGDDEGVTESWSVVVRLEVQGEHTWAAGPPVEAVSTWGAGVVETRLHQVREGDGYVGAGASLDAGTDQDRRGGAR